MSRSPLTMFRIGQPGPTNRLFYCTKDGVFLGPDCPIISATPAANLPKRFLVRPAADLTRLLNAAYGVDIDWAGLVPKLETIAKHLATGDMVRAQLTTVHLLLPEITDDGASRLLAADTLLKAGYNPAESRDASGRWTTDGSTASVSNDNAPLFASLGCEQERLEAQIRCRILRATGKLGPYSGFGSSVGQCIRGMVSARCGGNPTG